MSRALVVLAAVLTAAGAGAQQRAAPVAQFATGTVPGTVRYQVVLAGPGSGEMTATLGALENLEVLAGPVLAQEVSWRADETTAISVLTWAMRAKQAGAIGVGKTRVHIDGKDLTTNAVRGVAFAGRGGVAQSPASRLRMELSESRVMLGEPILVELLLDAANSADGWEVQASFPESWSERLPHWPPPAGAQRAHVPPGTVLGGWVVIPQKVGQLEIPPAVARPTTWPSDQESPVVPARSMASEPVMVEVSPLPAPPVSFSGAVGEFRFLRRFAGADVRAGDLAVVEVEVSGTGNLPLLDPPPLPVPPGVEVFPAEENHQWQPSRKGLSGSRRWRNPLEFAHAGRYEIPPVRFCSYRPGTGYTVHELPALTVDVLPASGPAPADVALPRSALAGPELSPLVAGGAAFLAGVATVLATLFVRSRRRAGRSAKPELDPDAELHELRLAVESWARSRFGVAPSAGIEAMVAAGCREGEAAEALDLVLTFERLRSSPGLSSAAEVLPNLRHRVARLTAGALPPTARLSE